MLNVLQAAELARPRPGGQLLGDMSELTANAIDGDFLKASFVLRCRAGLKPQRHKHLHIRGYRSVSSCVLGPVTEDVIPPRASFARRPSHAIVSAVLGAGHVVIPVLEFRKYII